MTGAATAERVADQGKQTLGYRIRAHRWARDWSQRDLADRVTEHMRLLTPNPRAGVSQAHISRLECSLSEPGPALLGALVVVLGLTEDDLATKDGARRP